MNKPIWIDTDTGVDDAVALLVACKLEQLDIVGASSVCGNTTLENAYRNCRDVFHLAGKDDIKVYKGSEKPLLKPLKTAPLVHGENGLGNAIIETSKAEHYDLKAWDALYEKAKELKGELIVVAIGPLTNIALTIILHPDFIDYVKEINIMGGAIESGNITPCAEFNIFSDPQAAEVVFKSGIFVRMFGLDVTNNAYLDDDDINEIKGYGNIASKLFEESTDLIYQTKERFCANGLCQHDSCPIIYLVHPEWFELKDCGIYVETQGTITNGKTVCDLYSDHKFEDRHCQVAVGIDQKSFAEFIKEIYRSY